MHIIAKFRQSLLLFKQMFIIQWNINYMYIMHSTAHQDPWVPLVLANSRLQSVYIPLCCLFRHVSLALWNILCLVVLTIYFHLNM